jgi:hypothetical protein
MKHTNNCNNCARGIKLNVNNDILCRIHGIVSLDFVCSRYLKLAWSAIENKPKCIECEFFISSQDQQEQETSPTIGFCQLFTVRSFDGEAKNACSKFCMKAERNIS